MSERKWKIGDWCEYAGNRCLVTRVRYDEDDATRPVRVWGVAKDPFRCTFETSLLDSLTPIHDCTGWDWQPKPKYRPFANALEFAPHSQRLISQAGGYSCVRRFNESTVDFGISGKLTYDELFKYCQFADLIDGKFVYSPCGVPE